jgi:hypothetical protein
MKSHNLFRYTNVAEFQDATSSVYAIYECPLWVGNGLTPKSLLLRMFLVLSILPHTFLKNWSAQTKICADGYCGRIEHVASLIKEG